MYSIFFFFSDYTRPIITFCLVWLINIKLFPPLPSVTPQLQLQLIIQKNMFSLCNKSRYCAHIIYRVKTWILKKDMLSQRIIILSCKHVFPVKPVVSVQYSCVIMYVCRAQLYDNKINLRNTVAQLTKSYPTQNTFFLFFPLPPLQPGHLFTHSFIHTMRHLLVEMCITFK